MGDFGGVGMGDVGGDDRMATHERQFRMRSQMALKLTSSCADALSIGESIRDDQALCSVTVSAPTAATCAKQSDVFLGALTNYGGAKVLANSGEVTSADGLIQRLV